MPASSRSSPARSRGIGAATAEALAAAGAHVILVARTASALEEVEERIHDAGGSATIAPLDLTEGEAIGKLAGAVAERWQKLDILVLNAAMLGSLTPVQDIDPKEYSRLLSLNLLANQALIAAFDPLLKKADRADVVALTSSVGAEPRAFWGAYGSSKAALESAARRLCRRDRLSRPDQGPHRRSRRDPHPDARQSPFPARSRKASSRRKSWRKAIVERLTADVPTGEKVRVEA